MVVPRRQLRCSRPRRVALRQRPYDLWEVAGSESTRPVGTGLRLHASAAAGPVVARWSELDYSKDRDGYTVNLTKEQLQAAPNATLEELTRDDGRAYGDLAFAHYRSKPYWH